MEGYHANDYEATRKRIEKSKAYQDLSTICVIPTPTGMLHHKFVSHFSGMMRPMNQKFHMHFEVGKEVGAAYSDALEMIFANPELSNWKFLLTVEHDNIIYQPDALLKLYESIGEYDAVGGLYFTKGENGLPMAYGQVNGEPLNFRPFLPPINTITPVHGLGMGFTLFKLDMLKDMRLPKPVFKTIQDFIPGMGARQYTQDLAAFETLGKLNYKFAIDSRVKIGHMAMDGTDFVW